MKQYLNVRYGSDVYPFEVVEVNATGKTIKVREMDVVADPDAPKMSNEWIYSSNEDNELVVYTLRKNGKFHRKGTKSTYYNGGCLTDEPYKNYDYSF